MSDVVFERVSCQYVGAPRPAISGFDLAVADGELLVLCGATESGKSTVLRMLAGLVPPTDGRILVNGVDIAVGEPPHVGLVFQNYALYPNLTVGQNIGLPLTQAGEAKRTVSERVARTAEHLDLTGLLGRNAAALSAGLRTRVALARGLVREPDVMLMDDPLANLQPEIRDEVAEMLVAAQQRHRITTLYASADADEALKLGDRVALLENGVLRDVVTPDQVGAASPGQRTAPRL